MAKHISLHEIQATDMGFLHKCPYALYGGSVHVDRMVPARWRSAH